LLLFCSALFDFASSICTHSHRAQKKKEGDKTSEKSFEADEPPSPSLGNEELEGRKGSQPPSLKFKQRVRGMIPFSKGKAEQSALQKKTMKRRFSLHETVKSNRKSKKKKIK